MENVIITIIQTYGVPGICLLLMAGMCYLIFGDRKNNWGNKIDGLGSKMDNMNCKVDLVEEKLTHRIDNVEKRMEYHHNHIQDAKTETARQQSEGLMKEGISGKLSKALRGACTSIDCDHIFLGSFHNGTTDLRGIHYCKFDILIDEFRDPLHLRKNDTDFQPLYKDENIMAYGDLPYALSHTDSALLTVDDPELFNLSDTLYRRCKSRDIKQIAFAPIHDKDGYLTGFVGCVSYIKREMKIKALEACAREIENIYE